MTHRTWSLPLLLLSCFTGVAGVMGCSEEGEGSHASPPPSVALSAERLRDFAWGEVAMDANEQFAVIAEAVPGFGGLYMDQGQAVVFLTDPNTVEKAKVMLEPVLARMLAWGRDPAVPFEMPEFRFEQGRYDWNELYRWYETIGDVFSVPGVVLRDIDETKNRIRIGVSTEEARRQVEKYVTTAGLPVEACVIENVEPVRFTSDTLRDRWWPPVAGLQVSTPRMAHSGCTLGWNANHFVLGRGFLTASHCTDTQGGTEGTTFYQSQGWLPFDFVGTEAHDAPYYTGADCPSGRRCRRSDVAFVRYDTTRTTGRLGKMAMPLARCQLPQTSCGLDIIQNTTFLYQVANSTLPSALLAGIDVDRMGRTTGQMHGPLTYTCIDTDVAGDNFHLKCQYVIATRAAGGDSGGPVFVRHGTTSNVDAVGITWGATDELAYFSLLWDGENEMGGSGAISLQ
ncbi:hypothetical protein [Chondromyces crocatus]|uniref:Peptidase S1 domain-containing protein n=1 Tax=Chondromyces crocatus TaxID=52 RepID=A0A0K1E9R6_CHOCO|nr:hypothetical protein [Chondromyces crocatus]AKT37605.1 uncharacterized protein CMC5_017460 [Chondromyces crocatus]